MTAGTSPSSPAAVAEADPRCHGDLPWTGEGFREMMSPAGDVIGQRYTMS